MTDIFYNLIHPLPNAVMSAIMGILLLYWLFAFLSGAGLEDLDLGIEFDADIPEIDIQTGLDINTDSGISQLGEDIPKKDSPSIFMQLLYCFNLGKIPFMLFFTIFIFFIWAGSLIATNIIDTSEWGAYALIILIPLSIIAIIFTKITTNPLINFFSNIGYKGEREIDFFGQGGSMLSTIDNDKIGTAEFVIDKNPIKLTVISYDGERLNYGDQIIIARKSDNKKVFHVIKK